MKRTKIPKETSSFNFRLAGQRSITSSLTSRSSDRSLITPQTERPVNGGKVSLSDFLSKRLHKSSVLPETTKDKPSTFLASREDFSKPLHNGDMEINDGVYKNCLLDKSVFDKFKPAVILKGSDNENFSLCVAGNIDSSQSGLQDSKKRGAAFDCGSQNVSEKRRIIVLGDDPRPSSCKYNKAYKKSEQSVPLYNHYANGKGWWDSNMEGIDNEQVGSSEVWEGVGSTTLGGLDWQ